MGKAGYKFCHLHNFTLHQSLQRIKKEPINVRYCEMLRCRLDLSRNFCNLVLMHFLLQCEKDLVRADDES
jgi:hypothetical protein